MMYKNIITVLSSALLVSSFNMQASDWKSKATQAMNQVDQSISTVVNSTPAKLVMLTGAGLMLYHTANKCTRSTCGKVSEIYDELAQARKTVRENRGLAQQVAELKNNQKDITKQQTELIKNHNNQVDEILMHEQRQRLVLETKIKDQRDEFENFKKLAREAYVSQDQLVDDPREQETKSNSSNDNSQA